MADKYVCVLSDVTGGTVKGVVRATLEQFPDSTVMLEVILGLRMRLEGLTRPCVVGLTMNPQVLSRLRVFRREQT
jgi:regulator of PEP synthase PpsR (kinase-PPPase family)